MHLLEVSNVTVGDSSGNVELDPVLALDKCCFHWDGDG